MLQYSIINHRNHAIHCNPRSYLFYNCKFIPFNHLHPLPTPTFGNHQLICIYEVTNKFCFTFIFHILVWKYGICLSIYELFLIVYCSQDLFILSQMIKFSFYCWVCICVGVYRDVYCVCMCVHACTLRTVWLFVTPWIVDCQAPTSPSQRRSVLSVHWKD